VTIEGSPEEIQKALQAISGSEERKSQDVSTRVPFNPVPSEKMTTANGQ